MNFLHLAETADSGYKVRTIYNAANADLTLYFCDAKYRSTSGFKLTQLHSRLFYVITTPGNPIGVVPELQQSIGSLPELYTINVAGNGISRFPVTVGQHDINLFVATVVSELHAAWPIGKILSGGQTGADWAGLVAGVELGIPTYGLFPYRYKQRGRDGVDVTQTESEVAARVQADCEKLCPVQL